MIRQVRLTIRRTGPAPAPRCPARDLPSPRSPREEVRPPGHPVDDQALYIESVEGLIVVLGCVHARVVNTLDHVSRLTGRRKIHAVVGGMHLGRASQGVVDCITGSRLRFGGADLR